MRGWRSRVRTPGTEQRTKFCVTCEYHPVLKWLSTNLVPVIITGANRGPAGTNACFLVVLVALVVVHYAIGNRALCPSLINIQVNHRQQVVLWLDRGSSGPRDSCTNRSL